MGSFSCLGSGLRAFKAKLFAVKELLFKPTCYWWLRGSVGAGPCQETGFCEPVCYINEQGRQTKLRRQWTEFKYIYFLDVWGVKRMRNLNWRRRRFNQIILNNCFAQNGFHWEQHSGCVLVASTYSHNKAVKMELDWEVYLMWCDRACTERCQITLTNYQFEREGKKVDPFIINCEYSTNSWESFHHFFFLTLGFTQARKRSEQSVVWSWMQLIGLGS